MNWDAAGAIGEIVGALMVVVTLVYLSRQIKQHGVATTSNSMDSWFSDYSALGLEVFADAARSEIVQNGFTNFLALNEKEQFQFHMWLVQHILSAQNMFLQTHSNTMHIDLAESVLTFNATMLKLPGAYQWWETGRQIFHPEFVKDMDRRIEAAAPVSDSWPWFVSKEFQQAQ